MQLKFALPFLRNLTANNKKEWFDTNKTQYQSAKAEFEQFVTLTIERLRASDPFIGPVAAKDCTFRIFKDVRFSKDGSPYKTNFGAFIAHGGRKSKFAGYYIHVEPEKSFVGGGIYMPEPDVLQKIRQAVFDQPETLKSILSTTAFAKLFSGIYGDKLKMAPKGFPKDFDNIDLLKHKHYAVACNVQDAFWESPKLADNLMEVFEAQKPFNQYLNSLISDS